MFQFNVNVHNLPLAGRNKGNQPNGSCLANPENYLAEEKMGNDEGNRKAVWIMKPVGMSRGRGIRLIDDIKNVSYADKVANDRETP